MKGKYLIAVTFLASWTVIAANVLPSASETQDDCPAVDSCPPKLISYEPDCSKYYECQNGLKELRSCTAGYYFSLRWRGCVDRQISDCLSTPNPPTPPPVGSCPAVDTCPPKLITHEVDCTKYYECHNGQRELRSCAAGYYFSLRWQGCVVREISDCPSTPTPPTPTPTPTPTPPTPPGECQFIGDRVRHECQCDKYYECKLSAGQWLKALRQCPAGHVFRLSTKTCEVGTDCNEPTPPITPPTPPKCIEGDRTRHECKCFKYYECSKGRMALRECTEGTIYDESTKLCIPGDPVTCIPKRQNCVPNDRMGHECKCDRYLRCVNDEWILEFCTGGNHFNNATKTCMHPLEAGCEKPGTCDPKTSPPFWQHECDCRLYYKCINGMKVVEACVWGYYYDRVNQKCVLATTIPKEVCKNAWDNWPLF